MSRRLDIGIAAYKDGTKLRKTIDALRTNSVTDWRLLIVDNPADDSSTREVIEYFRSQDARISAKYMPENVGYAGAVNEILAWAETEAVAYLDHDAYVLTRGWDEGLCGYLDRFHELALIFPNNGHYAINRGAYHECLWAAGFCWMMNRLAQKNTGLFDTDLGHHEEVDYCTRLRLNGYRLGCAPEIQVAHDETATRNPASQERINRGVVKWMDKWVAYFCGKNVNYHSPNVLRVTDWPVHALYLEEWYKTQLPGLNDQPEVVTVAGAPMDLIKVPKPAGFYKGRII